MVTETATIHTMPEEVLAIILKMLSPPEKWVAMSVCKRWNRLLRQRRLWKRREDCKAWEEMMLTLHAWLKMPPPSEDIAGLGEAGEILQATLHERANAYSFVKHTPGPISPDLRSWLNLFPGPSRTLTRTSLKPETPLMLNYFHGLLPGFNRFQSNGNEMFLYSDFEEFTWVEGSFSDQGDWVNGVTIKEVRMYNRTGEHWILEVRLHTVANLPIALEFVQEARSKEGKPMVTKSTTYQKLRSEATTRIEKEMSEDLSPERQCGVWLAMPEATGNPLRATILGPEGTPYEGGRFEVEITVPRSYPFTSPKCRFLTKVWHPNVDHKTGEVCLVDIPPSLLLIKILIHYQGLLSNPDLDDPMDLEVASQARDRPEVFEATARHWTWSFASPTTPEPSFKEKVRLVQEQLNVSPEEALTQLSLADWNLETVLNCNR